MPADDSLLGQNLVDARNEERRAAGAEFDFRHADPFSWDDRTESEYERGGSSLSELPFNAEREREEDRRADWARYEDAPRGENE